MNCYPPKCHTGLKARESSQYGHSAFRLAIASRAEELKTRRDLDTVVFVVTHMVDSLSHGAVLRRPSRLSLAAAREEAVRAVLAYLHA
jgi:hypothetical protein